jgi:hypothetical protein
VPGFCTTGHAMATVNSVASIPTTTVRTPYDTVTRT